MHTGILGDTPEFIWIQQVISHCLQESGDSSVMDMILLMTMCRDEPNSALFAMRFLGERLTNSLNGRPVTDAKPGSEASLCFILGSIYLAYSAYRSTEDNIRDPIPSEAMILSQFPVIVECANALPPM